MYFHIFQVMHLDTQEKKVLHCDHSPQVGKSDKSNLIEYEKDKKQNQNILKQKITHTLERHTPSIYLQSCNTCKNRARRKCFSDKALLIQQKLDFISI